MIDQTLQALAEPRRREILGLLADRELTAGEIAARFDVTRPAVSQHLAVLRAAGLVSERRDGTRRLYRARPAASARCALGSIGSGTSGLERLGSPPRPKRRRSRASARRRPPAPARAGPSSARSGSSARPEVVWAFWIDPSRIVRWMGRSADPRAPAGRGVPHRVRQRRRDGGRSWSSTKPRASCSPGAGRTPRRSSAPAGAGSRSS